MSESAKTKQKEKGARIRVKPKKDSLLLQTFASSNHDANSSHQFLSGSSPSQILLHRCSCGTRSIAGGSCRSCYHSNLAASIPSLARTTTGNSLQTVIGSDDRSFQISSLDSPGRLQAVNGGGAGEAEEPPPPPAPTTDQETINQAITVYAASRASTTRMGGLVLNTLRTLSSESEVGFEELGERTRAESREGLISWGRYDVAISDAFNRNVIMTSLRIAHEAIHQIQDEPYVD